MCEWLLQAPTSAERSKGDIKQLMLGSEYNVTRQKKTFFFFARRVTRE